MTPARATLDELRVRLAEYDGRSVTILGETEAQLSSKDGYLDALIALCSVREEHMAAGATWLIKSALEAKRVLTPLQVETLITQLPSACGWAAQLHLCQSIGLLDIPVKHAGDVAAWINSLLAHDRPFVRAWALDALSHVAARDDGLAPSFEDALGKAHDDEAASVRARARNLAKLR